MSLFRSILLVAALVLFLIDAFIVPQQPVRPRLQSLGLACATLAFLIPLGR